MHLNFFCGSDHIALKYLWNLLVSMFNLASFMGVTCVSFHFHIIAALVHVLPELLACYQSWFCSELSFPWLSSMHLSGCWSSWFKFLMYPACCLFGTVTKIPSHHPHHKSLACGIFSPTLSTLQLSSNPSLNIMFVSRSYPSHSLSF